MYRNINFTAFVLSAGLLLGGSTAFAQGKHGGGNPGHGGGQPQRIDRGGGQQRKEMPQQQQPQRQVQQPQQRPQDNGNARRQQQMNEMNQRRQQQMQQQQQQPRQQNDWNARRQQQMNDMNQRRQQQQQMQQQPRQQNDWNARRQQQQQIQQQRQPQQDWNGRGRQKQMQQPQVDWNARRLQQLNNMDEQRKYRVNEGDLRRDQANVNGDLRRLDDRQFYGKNGTPNRRGWNADGPRGNAYGLRGIWPGEFRGWRDPDKQARRIESQFGRFDPGYYSSGRGDRYVNTYNYQDEWRRERFARTVIADFFTEPAYYNDNSYWYQQPSYVSYYDPTPYYDQSSYYPVYFEYHPYPATYNSSPYYLESYYAPSSFDPYYSGYVDPYYANPYYSDTYYVSDVRSGVANIAGELLRGLLGQSYLQGLYDGQLAREQRLGVSNYYDPYVYNTTYYDDVYDVPYAVTLDDQRRCLSAGYRLGYRDAMLDRARYETYEYDRNVDLVSLMIGSTLDLSI